MNRFRMLAALALIYIFAIPLNRIGTMILRAVCTFDMTKPQASLLELFKDLAIAATSVLVASFLPLPGYRRTMMLAPAIVAAPAC